jgi:hypothetical protein
MAKRTDYAALIEKVNYSEVSKKLDELAKQPPPKRRKSAADLIAPMSDKLQELHGKGWSFEQLAVSLAEMGVPVKASVLRDLFGKSARKGKSRAKAAAPAA